MNPDQVNGLISAVSGLLSAILWPAIVVGIAIRFGPAISRKFVDADLVTIKAAGMEASFQKGQVELAAALGAAANARREATDGANSVDAKAIADDIGEALPNAEAFAKVTRSTVLWVDDRPENNQYERKALEAMGVRIELALSTTEALQRVQRRSYDLIISDMGRPGDNRAGYTLLAELRRSDTYTPFLIYAGSGSDAHMKEAIERGALGCTNSPQKLILMVSDALRRPQTGANAEMTPSHSEPPSPRQK